MNSQVEYSAWLFLLKGEFPLWSNIVSICSGMASIFAILQILLKVLPNLKKMREGQLCLLRQQILQIYQKGKENQQIDRYERTSLDYLYQAYKAEGGNSFVDDVYSKMRTWEVIE